jgi:hypothetical protein
MNDYNMWHILRSTGPNHYFEEVAYGMLFTMTHSDIG